MTWFPLKDERIEHALGHFQKDFEGGVCADNLGEWHIRNHKLCRGMKVLSLHIQKCWHLIRNFFQVPNLVAMVLSCLPMNVLLLAHI